MYVLETENLPSAKDVSNPSPGKQTENSTVWLFRVRQYWSDLCWGSLWGYESVCIGGTFNLERNLTIQPVSLSVGEIVT